MSPTPSPSCAGPDALGSSRSWPTTRVLFLLAGAATLAGTALAAGLSPWFALLPAAVGANQLLFVATGWCPASALLERRRARAGATSAAHA